MQARQTWSGGGERGRTQSTRGEEGGAGLDLKWRRGKGVEVERDSMGGEGGGGRVGLDKGQQGLCSCPSPIILEEQFASIHILAHFTLQPK